MTERQRRRDFLRNAGRTAAFLGVAASHAPRTSSADDVGSPLRPIVVGVMGLSRGRALARLFASQPNVDVRYLCDADSARIDAAQKWLNDGAQPHAVNAKTTQDFRHILDDPQVDALVCAAPNHWHAPATILACQAGKHVYVEKPCSHNPWEGEAMVTEAARHNRIVQLGTQRRSSPGTRLAIEQLHSGVIGRPYLARAWYHSDRGSIGRGHHVAIPNSLDYELWQGPAPRTDYLDNVVHYNWHWRWHWGNGELGNNGIHTLDLCRWGLGVDYPNRVSSSGGRYAFDDDQETPDTHHVGFEFADGKAITWNGVSCNRHTSPFVTFYGTEGTLDLDTNGNFQVFDREDKQVDSHDGSNGGELLHVANFVQAVRANSAGSLNAPILEGHRSTLLCHLGNIAHRTGRSLVCDETSGRIVADAEAMTYWKRSYEPSWQPAVQGS